ncbi:MAG: hypothetical protein JNL54_04125 [Kineosporiaceae bacterium]|nr:hypothetical protein [Kineosporiaceae bacterium]
MNERPQVRCSPELRAAHDLLVELVVAGADTVLPAFDAIVDAIVAYGDEEEGLFAFDDLVAEQLERLGEIWSGADSGPDGARDAGSTARMYAAAVEDFYAAGELDLAAACMRFTRGEMALIHGFINEALPLLLSAVDELDAEPSLLGGTARHLLGTALEKSGQRSEAIAAYRFAAELSQGQDMHGAAAGSLDQVARLLQDDDPAGAAQAWQDAARSWRLDGDEQEAAGSERSAGWALLDVRDDHTDPSDTESLERLAREAYEIGLRCDEVLAAEAALYLVEPMDLRNDFTGLVRLMEYVTDVGDRYEERFLQAMGRFVLAAALTLTGDIERGEDAARRALTYADDIDNPMLVAQLLGTLALAAAARSDAEAAAALVTMIRRLVGDALDEHLGLIDDNIRLVAAIRAKDVAGARSIAKDVVARADDGSVLGTDKNMALSYLLLLDLAMGDGAAAERHHEVLKEVRDQERHTGSRYALKAMEWVEPLGPMLAAGARRDWVTFDRLLIRTRDELLAEGAGILAFRLDALAGAASMSRGLHREALARLGPVTLASAMIVCLPPSSKERIAQREQLIAVSGLALRCATDVADVRAVAELVECVRSQAIPVPLEGAANEPLSIDRMLAMFSAQPPVNAASLSEGETTLPLPPRIVMPWGSLALDDHDDAALRYVPELTVAPRVRLVVPR